MAAAPASGPAAPTTTQQPAAPSAPPESRAPPAPSSAPDPPPREEQDPLTLACGQGLVPVLHGSVPSVAPLLWRAEPGASDRWRAAMNGYVASVQQHNQKLLGGAAAATQLARMHLAIHPRFTGYLESLPRDSTYSDELNVSIEIVLDACSGKIVRMGVTRPSGVHDFDSSVLEVVQQSAPFGAAPELVASPDGRVYVHWEFHRNPLFSCSTYFARQFMITIGQ